MRVNYIFYAVALVQLGMLSVLPPQAAGGQWQGREQLSAQERAWFDTFQRGTLYARGWKDITSTILAKAPVELKSDLQKNLEELGAKIGREWSKSNDIRKIDSEMLRQWGNMLERTAECEPAKIPQVVATLNQKVVALLD
jgi:hypothetical protein